MDAPKKGDWREARRRQAWELKQQGWRQKDIARALGVSAGAVSQWFSRVAREGEAGLASRPPAGPPSPIERGTTPADAAVVGAGSGSGRIRDVIAREFGVRYHKDHVRKLLREMGLSYQQPVERASQRDEAAIAAWVQERWADIKKG